MMFEPNPTVLQPREKEAVQRNIVGIEYTREKAVDIASYYRHSNDGERSDRHPRIYDRSVRAENITISVFVIVADAIPKCPIQSSKGISCIKKVGHKARCHDGDKTWWGNGRSEVVTEG